jgi:HAD superfamily hydrolase (TIGR01457 family)
MRIIRKELENLKLAIFDLDGVVYRGKKLIPHTDNIIRELKDNSIKVVYNSNNSTATRETYVNRLSKLNIVSNVSDFYTSASITATEITKIKKNANIFIIGETGLREELSAMGHKVLLKPSNYKEVDFLIVGLDREFHYNNLAIAQKCIMEGNAQFYATNTDATLPAARGFLPGAGVMVKAVEICTSTAPVKIFGKPQSYGIDLILNNYGISPNQACIFGDRLETDILAGNRAGITTVVVLTGVTNREKLEQIKNQSNSDKNFDKNLIPDLIMNTLNEIFV